MWQAAWQPPLVTVEGQRPHEPGGDRDENTRPRRRGPGLDARCPQARGRAVVISIGMLTAGSDPAGYYLTRRAGCPAEYYTGSGEPAGVWLGRGAAAAGLSGELDGESERVLRGLLDGRAPDGRVLVAPVLRADPRARLPARPLVDAIRAEAGRRGLAVRDLLTNPSDRAMFTALAAGVDRPRRRAVTVNPARAGRLAAAGGLDPHVVYRAANTTDHGTTTRRQDGPDHRLDNPGRYAAALAWGGQRVDVRRPGIDVTVSAPKSVSVLYALGDPDVAAAVRAAHQAAVSEALAYLESVAGHGLRGHQGGGQRAEKIQTAGWIMAAFEHRTSRAGDPQLHTHLVVPNLLNADGRWSAVDSRAVHRHALTASYLYHSVLLGQLTARLGIAWTTPAKASPRSPASRPTCSRPSPPGDGRSCAPCGRPGGPVRTRRRLRAWSPDRPSHPLSRT